MLSVQYRPLVAKLRAVAAVRDAVDKDRSRDTKCYAHGWITVLLFLVSIAGHWIFGWYAFLDDAAETYPAAGLQRVRD